MASPFEVSFIKKYFTWNCAIAAICILQRKTARISPPWVRNFCKMRKICNTPFGYRDFMEYKLFHESFRFTNFWRKFEMYVCHHFSLTSQIRKEKWKLFNLPFCLKRLIAFISYNLPLLSFCNFRHFIGRHIAFCLGNTKIQIFKGWMAKREVLASRLPREWGEGESSVRIIVARNFNPPLASLPSRGISLHGR